MEDVKLFESALFSQITGACVRPGGFAITKRGIEACKFVDGSKILDVGCGRGAAAEFIGRKFGYECTGIDRSRAMIEEGLSRNSELNLIEGDGHKLPFAESSFDGVLFECSFSLMENKLAVLEETNRVLKKTGKLIINDLYLKKGILDESACVKGITCILHALNIGDLRNWLIKSGFDILILEDHTPKLKELMANIILQYGSLDCFWEKVMGLSNVSDSICSATRDTKMGYFLLIAQRIKNH